MSTEWIIPAALGLGLSASAGFRVFVPLLVAAVAARTGIIPLNESFSWMSSWPAIICFGTATFFEILAYYIPFVDNLLDAVNAPLAIAGGTLIATSVLPTDHELVKWIIGFIIGGGTAGVIHTGTSFLRLASTKTTAGAANAALATGEQVAAFGLSISSLFIPVAVAVIIIVILMLILRRMIGKANK